jgi:hypothetical protein
MDNPTRHDGGASPNEVATVTLTFTPATWHLDIKAKVGNFDMALAMLDQARRWFEARVRARDSIQIAQELAQQERDMQIAAAVRNGGMRQ